MTHEHIQAELIVAKAREWCGTPYVHQAATKHVGADCLGLIRGVWREVIGAEPTKIPPYTNDWSEPQGDERLWKAAAIHLVELNGSELRQGDVVLFRMRRSSVAKHLGIISDTGHNPRFVHAFTGKGVVESPLSRPWRRRIVSCFEFPQEA